MMINYPGFKGKLKLLAQQTKQIFRPNMNYTLRICNNRLKSLRDIQTGQNKYDLTTVIEPTNLNITMFKT